MRRIIAAAALAMGVLLMLAAVAVAYVRASNTVTIGAAGLPTFAFFLGQAAWLLWLGAALILMAVVLWVRRKQ